MRLGRAMDSHSMPTISRPAKWLDMTHYTFWGGGIDRIVDTS